MDESRSCQGSSVTHLQHSQVATLTCTDSILLDCQVLVTEIYATQKNIIQLSCLQNSESKSETLFRVNYFSHALCSRAKLHVFVLCWRCISFGASKAVLAYEEHVFANCCHVKAQSNLCCWQILCANLAKLTWTWLRAKAHPVWKPFQRKNRLGLT